MHFPFIAKQIAWRVTAAWIWLYVLAAMFGQRAHINIWEQNAALLLARILTQAGFAPSHPALLPRFVKLLWLLTMCSFSWVQMAGFFLFYLPSSPLLLVFRKRRKQYKGERAKALEKARREGKETPHLNISFALFVLLLAWFLLYGETTQRYPLVIAMVITGLLFISRVSRALVYAAPADFSQKSRSEAFFSGSRDFVRKTFENLKEGKITSVRQLNWSIWLATRFLRTARFASAWLYGRAARRRAALLVLIRFMANLAILGAISIMFWAFVIKYAAIPTSGGLKEALFASASRTIPGIPDASSLRVGANIQTFASVTAWLIFVLYAGPVASLFPAFQDRIIAQTAHRYSSLRSARKALYRFIEFLRPIRQLALDHPEIIPFAKNVILLRKQSNLKEFLLGQPEYVRSLIDRPEEADLLRTLGVQLPDLEALVREIPQEAIERAVGVVAQAGRIADSLETEPDLANGTSTDLKDTKPPEPPP